MSAVPFSFTRTRLIAQNTLIEAARQKLFHVLVLLAFGFVIGARWLRDFNFGTHELEFLADCGFGALTFFGSALAIVVTGQAFFSELENRTALTLLAKPVWRTEFILGKFIGIAALIAAFVALVAVVLAGMLWSRETELLRQFPEAFAAGRVVNYANVVVAGLLHWLKLAVLAAFVLLVASFAQTQLFALITGFVVLVICQLQYIAQEAYVRAGSSLGRYGGALLASVFPNFHLFGLADTVSAAVAPMSHLLRIGAYAAGYIVVACALTVFCFRRREI